MKYPAAFADASHGLVLGAYAEQGYAWARWCKIIRRPPGMIAIEGSGGCTWTFTVEEKDGKEFGHIVQAAAPYREAAKEFKVIPFNIERN